MSAFIIQGQLKGHFACKNLCIWRSPSVSIHSFRHVDETWQLPLFCFSFVSTMATTSWISWDGREDSGMMMSSKSMGVASLLRPACCPRELWREAVVSQLGLGSLEAGAEKTRSNVLKTRSNIMSWAQEGTENLQEFSSFSLFSLHNFLLVF